MAPIDTLQSGNIHLGAPTANSEVDGELFAELQSLRRLVGQCEAEISEGSTSRMPGNVAFLADGRVLCRERSQGDSRYPYGSEGFNFWVNASGSMRSNRGLYYLFLPTHDGQEPPIAFFVGCRPDGAESYTSHALLPVPLVSDGESRVIDRYTVFGHDATYFVAETPEILSAVRVFVDQSRAEHAHINFSVLIQNQTGKPLDVYASSYMNPFCRHQFVETNEDCWFKKIYVEAPSSLTGLRNPDPNDAGITLPPFVITTNEDIDRVQSISNYSLVRRTVRLHSVSDGDQLPVTISIDGSGPNGATDDSATKIATQVCTSRLTFVGSTRRSLNSANFLTTGRFEQEVPMTVFKENAIVGDLSRLTLPGDSYLRADHVFSTPDSQEVLDVELDRPISATEVDHAYQQVRKRSHQTGDLQLKVNGGKETDLDATTLNQFFPYLKKQVAVCALLKGYMHPSANSLIGFRDVLQAIDGHLFDQPAASREKILETLNHVLVDGRCPRQYSLPVNGAPGQADLRKFIDQGVWAISTVYNYLSVTGDSSLLDEIVGYHRPSPTDENSTVPVADRDSVLEHLLRIMDYLAAQRDSETGLVLALYGDWNDALDGLGISIDPEKQFGTGVSVMTSLQLYQCCAEISKILQTFAPGRFEEQASNYSRLREELREGLLKYAVVAQKGTRKILHGWGDQRQYFVGSFCDSDGLARDGLTSNAFWILSDMLEEDPSLKADIVEAFDRLDSTYGLKTFEPGFAPDAPGVGRITKLPRGTAENGAVYVHATTFAIAALFRIGEPEKAWRQIEKVLPFSSHHKTPSHSPFVMPNSYIDNPQLDLNGQSMNDWQTGCSNVLLKLLVRYVFGFQPELDFLRIAPAHWYPFDSLDLSGLAHGKRIRLSLTRGDVPRREVRLNGKSYQLIENGESSGLASVRIPYAELVLDEINEIAVLDPA